MGVGGLRFHDFCLLTPFELQAVVDAVADHDDNQQRGAYRGRMPRYDIIDRAEAQAVPFVEADLQGEVEAATWRRAKKMGL